jgi:hypothetical protein
MEVENYLWLNKNIQPLTITKCHRNSFHLHITSDSIANIAQPPIRTEIDDFFLDNKSLINVIATEIQPQSPFIARTTKARH